MSEDFLTPREVAALLRVEDATVMKWRQKRIGPPYVRAEGTVRYPRQALDAWLRERLVDHSSKA